VFTERTSVGLDVHACSVAAAAIDGVTGELFQTSCRPAMIGSWSASGRYPARSRLSMKRARLGSGCIER
jgi:hypothetical protein